ncbi:pre-RNA processing PIH1/Nop17-domain-containing protein [Cokeromyces recurvatus]|uniref:pre-RNA processing PIH1/Nop17-domain-containing protein n=1 Tax=Cokeromyces recurvatus TaxID=90255 RepID=UPI00221FD912|nr:pre-RNA processing PIH1/Nop17-domain-containing protein [Cokeromyces recurvatus]KAI7904147.1 pre-RNA processing PIH1/Nop17-domain-containing protein [Cokeromyces recurvatus]
MAILEVIEDNESPSNPFLFNKPKPDFNKLSKEEKKVLLDHIASQVIADDPKLFEQMATNFLNQTTQEDFNTVEIQPQPGYVCKTHIVSSTSKYKVGTVVYINICYASSIPAPPIASEKEIEKALNAEPDATYKVPLSMGEPQQGEKGALIMSACINTQPFLRSEKNLDFRLYILELAMEYVEEIISASLSREFTMPQVKSMGVIPSRILRLPKPSLMTAIRTEVNKTNKKEKWTCRPTEHSVENNYLKLVIPMPNKNI